MNIPRLIEVAEQAISANFRIRNARSFHSFKGERHTKEIALRRRQIREWVAVLRIARDPSLHESVLKAIGSNVFMAHDLRLRVIMAGRDAQFEQRRAAQGEDHPVESPRG